MSRGIHKRNFSFWTEGKSEMPANKLYDVDIPNSNGDKDENKDLNICLCTSSIPIRYDKSRIQATLKCVQKTCRLGNTGLNADVEVVNIDPNRVRLPTSF